MAGENQDGQAVEPVEGQESQVNQSTTTAQPEYSDVERQALSQGWVPQDQYDGPGKWRDAEEFLDRGELFHKIEEQKKHSKQLEYTVQELKKHYKGIRESAYRAALNKLKAEKRDALDEGDNGRVVEIDEQIANTKAEASVALRQMDQPAVAVEAPAHPGFVVWQNRNPWYERNAAMRAFADEVGTNLALRGMQNPIEILQEVERRTRKEYPDAFQNPNRAKPGTVEGAGNRSGRGKNDSFELSPAEKKAMKRFVDAGVLTEAEYIRDIKEERGV